MAARPLGALLPPAFALLVLGSCVQAAAAPRTLAVPEVAQGQSRWCWAGVSDAVLAYFGRDVEQCWTANFAWSRDDCCRFPAWSGCNRPNSMFGTAGSLQAILAHWCVDSSAVSRALSFPETRGQIDRGRPLVIRYGWDGGGGHFLVVRGYATGRTRRLHVMNPWPGEGYGVFTYDAVRRTVGDHSWTHTLERIRRNRRRGDWKVSRSEVHVDHGVWDYVLRLTESAGGCGRVRGFSVDHYDALGAPIGTSHFTAEDFAALFGRCTDGDEILPRDTAVCGRLETSLGGASSGSVRYRFTVGCGDGTTIVRRRRFTLDEAAGGSLPGDGRAAPAGTRQAGHRR